MVEPSQDDVKRFARKVYLFCAAALGAGALLWDSMRHKQGVVYTILEITGIALAVLSLIMLVYFIRFFVKVNKRMEAGEDLLKTDQDSQR